MKRLIEKGLMFGNLIEVSSPALVERYNRAMKALCGRETKLTDFHIDLAGFSPEIGDELGDMLYLNPNGCNRQFILLSVGGQGQPAGQLAAFALPVPGGPVTGRGGRGRGGAPTPAPGGERGSGPGAPAPPGRGN